MMAAKALDHVNIVTADLAATVRFYCDLLGLEEGPRPAFASPGAWLYLDGRPVLHLVLRQDAAPDPSTGAIDHLAFRCEDFDGLYRRLDRAGVPYETREAPGGEIRQIFLRDPNGVKVELNFSSPSHACT